DAVGYPENPKPQSPWAQRLMKAHNNAVENLVLFAALVLAANALGVSTPAIGTAAAVYFWARLVHALVYTFKVPWLRTLSFTVAWIALAVIAWQILAA
ncbi:MAG: MAPEG family protein, partial [bacterium]